MWNAWVYTLKRTQNIVSWVNVSKCVKLLVLDLVPWLTSSPLLRVLSLSLSLLAPFLLSWPLPPPLPVGCPGAQLEHIWAWNKSRKSPESVTMRLYPPPRLVIAWADELRRDRLRSCALRPRGTALKKTHCPAERQRPVPRGLWWEQALKALWHCSDDLFTH